MCLMRLNVFTKSPLTIRQCRTKEESQTHIQFKKNTSEQKRVVSIKIRFGWYTIRNERKTVRKNERKKKGSK